MSLIEHKQAVDEGGTHCTFPLFSKFPREIRLKIYRLFDDDGDKITEIEALVKNCLSKPQNVIIKPLSPAPQILHISHESRAEGLRIYFKAISYNEYSPVIYMKPHNTILILRTPTLDKYGFDVNRFEELYFNAVAKNLGTISRLYTAVSTAKFHDVKHTILCFKLAYNDKDPYDYHEGFTYIKGGPVSDTYSIYVAGKDFQVDLGYLFEHLVSRNSPFCWRWISTGEETKREKKLNTLIRQLRSTKESPP